MESMKKSERVNQKFKGKWSKEEQDKFLYGLKTFGKNWKEIRKIVPTRNLTQIRSHAQKVIKKLQYRTQQSSDNLTGLQTFLSLNKDQMKQKNCQSSWQLGSSDKILQDEEDQFQCMKQIQSKSLICGKFEENSKNLYRVEGNRFHNFNNQNQSKVQQIKCQEKPQIYQIEEQKMNYQALNEKLDNSIQPKPNILYPKLSTVYNKNSEKDQPQNPLQLSHQIPSLL